jgi:hypothetical protein
MLSWSGALQCPAPTLLLIHNSILPSSSVHYIVGSLVQNERSARSPSKVTCSDRCRSIFFGSQARISTAFFESFVIEPVSF